MNFPRTVRMRVHCTLLSIFAILAPTLAAQDQLFSQLVGPGNVGSVTQTSPLTVPYITWGGDMATFYANEE